MVLRANREAQPAPLSVRADLVREFAFENKQLHTLLIGDLSQIRFRLPALKAHYVREPGLLVEWLASNTRGLARLPAEASGIEDYMSPFPA